MPDLNRGGAPPRAAAALDEPRPTMSLIPPPTGPAAAEPNLRREITLIDAVAIVVGTTIGSAIFLIPNTIAAQLTAVWQVFAVWLVGGILAVLGALSLAELGAMYPGTGGVATYLSHAYGRLVGFLYAWGLLLMIHSGSIAALGVAFGLYAGQIFPISPGQQKLASAVVILGLTAVSYVGVRSSKLVQNLIAGAKVAGLAAMIFLVGTRGTHPIHLLGAAGGADQATAALPLAGFGVALIAVLWAYEGWHVISFVGGEMKSTQRDLPRSLYVGTAIIMAIYVLANVGYYHALSASQIRGSNAVAALAMGVLLGPVATRIISILVLVSILGSLNGLILTGPRVYYAMAQDGAFLRPFGHVSERYRTPTVALVVQGVWATALALSGTYQQLFTDVIFTAWIFYGLAAAGVLVLRRTQPDRARPFRVPAYPWVPLTFSVAAAALIVSTLVNNFTGGLVGLAFIAVGIPVYFFGASRWFKTDHAPPD